MGKSSPDEDEGDRNGNGTPKDAGDSELSEQGGGHLEETIDESATTTEIIDGASSDIGEDNSEGQLSNSEETKTNDPDNAKADDVRVEEVVKAAATAPSRQSFEL